VYSKQDQLPYNNIPVSSSPDDGVLVAAILLAVADVPVSVRLSNEATQLKG